MAKSNEEFGGPFVTAAMLCNTVVEDADGVVSALRIIDELRIIVPAGAPTDFPSKSQPLEVSLFALIIIRRGDAHVGNHKLRLVIEKPDGKTSELLKADVAMPEYPNGTATVKARMKLALHSPGVFWIDVILGKQRLSRMALNLMVVRQAESTAKKQP